MTPERSIDSITSPEQMIDAFDRRVMEGLEFDDYGINRDRLFDNTFGTLPEELRTDFADQVITHYLNDEIPPDRYGEPWYFPKNKHVTSDMQRKKGTMQAILVATTQLPSEQVNNRLKARIDSLFEDEIFALPFLPKLESVLTPGEARGLIDSIGHQLGTDYELDSLFVERIGDYAQMEWAKGFALRAITNPGVAAEVNSTHSSSRDNLFWLREQPWFSEAWYLSHAVTNAIATLSRSPAGLVEDLHSAQKYEYVDTQEMKGTAHMHLPVGLGFLHGGTANYLKTDSDFVRRGREHDVLGFLYATKYGGLGGD